MADEKGSSSNSLHSFMLQAERDRSLQQDRINGTNARSGPRETFRSAGVPPTNGDGAFDSFQAGLPAEAQPRFPQAGPAPPMGLNMNGAVSPRTAILGTPYAPHVAHAAQMLYAAPVHHAAPAHHAAQAPPSTQTSGAVDAWDSDGTDWVTQYANMDLSNGPVPRPAPMVPDMVAAPLIQQAHRNYPGVDHGPMHAAQPTPQAHLPPYYHYHAGSAQFGQPLQPTRVYPAVQVGLDAPMQAGATTTATTTVTTMPSDEAFNQAFGEYDDAEFEEELDNWMAEHGPYREAIRHRDCVTDEVVATMERLADELDERRASGDPAVLPQAGPEADARRAREQQDELADAAMTILGAVSGNTSSKFRESSFLDLMRRIRDREVVVHGDELVDAETGQAIVTNLKEAEHQDEHENGKNGGAGGSAPGKGNGPDSDAAAAA